MTRKLVIRILTDEQITARLDGLLSKIDRANKAIRMAHSNLDRLLSEQKQLVFERDLRLQSAINEVRRAKREQRRNTAKTDAVKRRDAMMAERDMYGIC